MHASRFPGNLVTHAQPAPVHDMSAVWNLAARLRLCHVPVRLTQALSPFNYASTIGKEPSYLFTMGRIEEPYTHSNYLALQVEHEPMPGQHHTGERFIAQL